MLRYILLSFLFIGSSQFSIGQDTLATNSDLPYYEIPEAAKSFTAGTMVSRMVDGLGFRYYWATNNLKTEDLDFKVSDSGRTTLETLEHIYGLSKMILNAVTSSPNGREDSNEKSYKSYRKNTLLNLQKASELLKVADAAAIENMKIIFVRGDKSSEYPFWNAINGPIEDAVWHVGQIVMLRRASGNPWNSKASVFSGKVRS